MNMDLSVAAAGPGGFANDREPALFADLGRAGNLSSGHTRNRNPAIEMSARIDHFYDAQRS
jgi:hypothetical protein